MGAGPAEYGGRKEEGIEKGGVSPLAHAGDEEGVDSGGRGRGGLEGTEAVREGPVGFYSRGMGNARLPSAGPPITQRV